jgi:hypothetical protein
MGIPSSGAYVGAAVTGTPDLPSLEKHVGRALPIHRMYFEAGQVTSALNAVKSDLASGRLPWISFKMPYSWADMAAGKGDAWATDLADKLAKVGGPVWLAFHHEPEGDGNIQDWVRMQQHLAPIIHAHTDNVAYTVIYTGWDALFGPTQYRLDQVWPGDQYVDVAGFDVYNDYMSGRNGNYNIPMLDPMKYFGVIGPWSRQHHVDWAVAEMGYTSAAAKADPNWLQGAFSDLVQQGGKALTYFDSSLNSITDWTLSDGNRLSDFTSLIPRSATLC